MAGWEDHDPGVRGCLYLIEARYPGASRPFATLGAATLGAARRKARTVLAANMGFAIETRIIRREKGSGSMMLETESVPGLPHALPSFGAIEEEPCACGGSWRQRQAIGARAAARAFWKRAQAEAWTAERLIAEMRARPPDYCPADEWRRWIEHAARHLTARCPEGEAAG